VNFRIADTFTDSLGRLTTEEQKTVKTTVFDLQANPKHPSLQFHKIEQAKDSRFWSIRGNLDLRLIVHKDGDDLLVCYVDHHDDAYDWARRRKIEVHPKTGAAQLVEIRESVREIVVPKYVEEQRPAPPKAPLFARFSDDELLAFGVPTDWLADARTATEDTIFDLSEHLPREAAEALLELATGGKPVPQTSAPATTSPFEHPDAQRRFRVMRNIEELERALDAPWEKWSIFLHPAQQTLVERKFAGAARVSGSAGTGKTIVALHRAVFLARRNPETRVLITTFSDTLANALRAKLRRLVSGEPRLGERIEAHSINAIGRRLYERNVGPANLASRDDIREVLRDAVDAEGGSRFSPAFLLAEWEQVVDAWQIDSWEGYRDVARLGRKTRLSEAQRQVLWTIFEHARAALGERGLITWSALFQRLAVVLAGTPRPAFNAVVIDEAQDISITQLRFLAAMTGGRENALFFAGDLGQRIFQQPFSWKALGVDVRGRSSTLKINYRTSHQIRSQADRLLDPEIADVDGNTERRDGTISTFNGPAPEIRTFATEVEEISGVSDWLRARVSEGSTPSEIAIFVRSNAQIDRARAAAEGAAIASKVLDESVETTSGFASICAMHLAKGLEFRTVAVMACDDDVIPLQERIESIGDESDLEEVYASERHLLYVACTRARDNLLITGVEPASEFLQDIKRNDD
jgi:superfamily I DNA/RNA helicase/mRNA-degrading endonuclease RelE of RelBE toxin-antitoxin system